MSVHVVITNGAGEVLQIKATYDCGRRGLPGVSLEPGETVHQTLLRECQEELYCPVTMRYMSGVYYHQAYQPHACIFRCDLPAGAQIQLGAEHSDHRFFPLDDLGAVQRQRVADCPSYNGRARSATF